MCLNLNADPKRSAHFFSLVYFVLTLVLSILEMAAKCASLHDSSCHHYHLSMLPNVRKEIPLPPHHHLRDTQRQWWFTTRNPVSINQIVSRILLQISIFEPHSSNISCFPIFFFFFLETYPSIISSFNAELQFLLHQLFTTLHPKNQPVSKSYSILSLNSPRIWPLLTTPNANTQSTVFIYHLFSRLVN